MVQIAFGGALGAMMRALAVRALALPGFPLGTMVVNIVGSFVMGLLAVVLAARAPGFAPFLLTGVLGGFTTFSAFSLDALTLVQRGQAGLAAAYVAGSVALSLLAVVAGAAAGRGIA